MPKFGRNYKLTISEDNGPTTIISYPITIDFSIMRATYAFSGDATFRIYNLNQETRGKIYRSFNDFPKMIRIKFEAGYGNNLSTIFDGNIMWARSSRGEGQTNFITEINAFDYGFVKTDCRSSWTAEGQDASKLNTIKRLVSDLKVPVNGVPTSLPVGAIGNFDITPRPSVSFGGPTWGYIIDETGGNCFIDNGKVFCISPNEVVQGDVTEISNDTGLLGTPKSDGTFLFIDMVFEPGLKVGQRVNLKSTSSNVIRSSGQVGFTNRLINANETFSLIKNFSGIYKVVGLDHAGTISGAVSGKLKTKVQLRLGSQGQTNPFLTVGA